ncbi:ComEA family DNA-binding protein [Salsuginibacillus kocurii]|uniref:ComEA family DNA-binding protein n=1 Tax=Salsuginibacillus kocurii TaxID=427078 RepID=UPI00037E34FA|nr:ComEA family DNA-binding protein [Salsuginibacillus kocurii]
MYIPFKKEWILMGLGLLIAVVLFISFTNSEEPVEDMATVDDWNTEVREDEKDEMKLEGQKDEVEEKVTVDIKGEVNKPGVYELTSSARVIDAIEKAGGLNESAEARAVNQAERLVDEMVVYVPHESDYDEATGWDEPPAGDGGGAGDKLRINSAEQTELETLPGIGPQKAQAILEFREEHGPFEKVEELEEVNGIGPASLEQISELIEIR